MHHPSFERQTPHGRVADTGGPGWAQVVLHAGRTKTKKQPPRANQPAAAAAGAPRMGSMHQAVSFLQALTNADADGRVLVNGADGGTDTAAIAFWSSVF